MKLFDISLNGRTNVYGVLTGLKRTYLSWASGSRQTFPIITHQIIEKRTNCSTGNTNTEVKQYLKQLVSCRRAEHEIEKAKEYNY